MIRDITDLIIHKLKEKNIDTQEYLGQLSNQEEPDLIKTKLPISFIDYTGDYVKGYDRFLRYNLYFVNISYSNNSSYRKQTQDSVIELLQNAQEALFNIVEANIHIKQSKKIFDAKIEKGYLVVFTMQIEAQITRKETIDWIEQ